MLGGKGTTKPIAPLEQIWQRVLGDEIVDSRSQVTRALVDHYQELAESNGELMKVFEKTRDIL